MSNFDIRSLEHFRPPKYLCQNCFALLYGPPCDYKTRAAACPVCGVTYVPTEEFPFHCVDKYLETTGLLLRFDNLLSHSQKLAGIATRFQRSITRTPKAEPEYPPIRALLESLQAAQQFVHFTSYGLSYILLGALQVTAVRVPVRGVVSATSEGLIDELTRSKHELPYLQVQVFERYEAAMGWKPVPHQKIVIIDGLLAFKGSANLTDTGWRQAGEGRELLEVVTNLAEVSELNNRLFSPVWASKSEVTAIEMTSAPF